jgi:hypothetical protein
LAVASQLGAAIASEHLQRSAAAITPKNPLLMGALPVALETCRTIQRGVS